MKGGGRKESEEVFQIFFAQFVKYTICSYNKKTFYFETQNKLKVPFKFFVTLR